MFGWFYFDWSILIVIPAMLFAFWAQLQVNSTFSKYSKTPTRSGQTAAEAARRLLDANGLHGVTVNRIPGRLTDHYDPRTRTLNLSEAVYDSASAAAVGVACHEAGHAIQHADSYAPLTLRMQIIPLCRIGSGLAMPNVSRLLVPLEQEGLICREKNGRTVSVIITQKGNAALEERSAEMRRYITAALNALT